MAKKAMKQFNVLIQVIKVYSVTVEAESGEDAVNKVEAMSTIEIADQGSLKDVETDHCELVGEA